MFRSDAVEEKVPVGSSLLYGLCMKVIPVLPSLLPAVVTLNNACEEGLLLGALAGYFVKRKREGDQGHSDVESFLPEFSILFSPLPMRQAIAGPVTLTPKDSSEGCGGD